MRIDPGRALWRIFWSSTRQRGVLDPPLEGRFDGRGHGVFQSEDTVAGRPVHVRFDWTDAGQAGARWVQSFSLDRGATWTTNWVMTFQRDPSPAADFR